MNLSYDQAQFLMNLIADYCTVKGEVDYVTSTGDMVLTYPEIENLFLEIQDYKLNSPIREVSKV